MKTTPALAIAVAAAFQSAMLFAQEPGGMQSVDQQKHRAIMPIHAKIVEMQKEQDTEIDGLLAELNAASGEKRIDAIVVVLNKLVEQRKAMNAEVAAHLDK